MARFILNGQDILGVSPSGTVLTQTLTAGSTFVTFTHALLTSTARVDVYTDTFGVDPVGMTPGNGTLTIQFPSQSSDVSVSIEIKGV